MSDMRETGTRAVPSQARRAEREPTAWVGWVLFAGIIMVIAGSFQVIAGLAALVKDEYFVVTDSGLLISVDYTAWGWVHLVLGAVVLLAGFAAMAGRTWGLVVGITLAVLQAIVNIAFLAAYPVWSTIVIALDVIVIYALAVHGREAAYRS